VLVCDVVRQVLVERVVGDNLGKLAFSEKIKVPDFYHNVN
jgi:hypothetical protein